MTNTVNGSTQAGKDERMSLAEAYLQMVDEYKVQVDQLTADFLEKISTLKKSGAAQIEQSARDRDEALVEKLLTDELEAA